MDDLELDEEFFEYLNSLSETDFKKILDETEKEYFNVSD